jgi:hypothetical protein
MRPGKTVKRNTLTQHLRTIEAEVLSGPASPDRFAFAGGRYTIRVANDLESRRKAYQLVYRLYLEREYAQPHPSKMWLSIFDALPETVTLLVEKQAEGCGLKAEGKTEASSSPSAFGLQPSVPSVPVGALTVVFDSPMGLPADELYRPELNALRASGLRPAEIISLGVAEEAGAGSQILVKLFNFVYLLSKKVRGATDFVITVNPRHVRFYEKTLLFEAAGPEREYDKVGGAPALLLRLDLDIPEERVYIEHGPAETRPAKSRTLYPMFLAPAEEPEVVAGLAASLRPMTEQELGYFFVAETDLLAEATPEQRAWIEGLHSPAGRTP